MEKGKNIMVIVLAVWGVIALIHWLTMRFARLSPERKLMMRQSFFMIYAIYFIAYGIYLIADRQEIVLGVSFVAIGATQGVLRFYRREL
jgi:hypothetical protein